ncbi:MAG TPA: hypothetical protein VFG68_02835 [Fimbriiglobus sp.]|nr:hypothetical protein [Fimbriiglobus sp.]
MAAKLLAGVIAALLVTGAGVYVAFPGNQTRDTEPVTQQTVSEGPCCALKAQLACEASLDSCPLQAGCAGQSCPADALAACTGSAVLAAPAKAVGKANCCAE